MGDTDDRSTKAKAAGTAGTVAGAGAAVGGAQAFLLGDEAEAFDLDVPVDRVAPALDLDAHDVGADDGLDSGEFTDDVDALLDDDPLLGTASVLDGHGEAPDDDPLDDLDDPGLLGLDEKAGDQGTDDFDQADPLGADEDLLDLD